MIKKTSFFFVFCFELNKTNKFSHHSVFINVFLCDVNISLDAPVQDGRVCPLHQQRKVSVLILHDDAHAFPGRIKLQHMVDHVACHLPLETELSHVLSHTVVHQSVPAILSVIFLQFNMHVDLHKLVRAQKHTPWQLAHQYLHHAMKKQVFVQCVNLMFQ